MAVNILKAKYFSSHPFVVPKNYNIILDFEASGTVYIYFLKDGGELESFIKQERNFPSVKGQKKYNSKINLASLWPKPNGIFMSALSSTLTTLVPQWQTSVLPNSTWYLVIGNITDNNIAVFFRVYNAP